MELVPHWRRVLKHAWSIRLMLLAGLFSGLEVGLPLIDGLFDIPQGVFAALSGITTAAAFISRLVAQSNVPTSGGSDASK
jgi:hypothetical protein